MSKELDKLLETNYTGGIKDYNQIATIVTALLDAKTSYITNTFDMNKKCACKTIINICHLIPLTREHILMSEIITLLFHANLFKDFATPTTDGKDTDFYIYPTFLAFELMTNIVLAAKSIPEVAQFLNINFYKYSQHMTNLISKFDKKRGVHICGHLMHQLQILGNGNIPDNAATVGDIFSMLKQNFRPLYPGIDAPRIYQERIMAVCLAVWDMLVVYPCEAHGYNHARTFTILKKYGDQSYYSELNEFDTESVALGVMSDG